MARSTLWNPTDKINSGIFLDPANDRVPLWADGKNIVFDPQGPRPVDGFSRMVLSRPSSKPIRGMLQAWIEGKKYVFFGDEDNLYRYDDDAESVATVSKVGGYAGGNWVFAQWGNWVLATNNVDAVQVYKESVGSFADLTHDLGGTLTCKLIFVVRNSYAVLLGTDDEGRVVRWSDEDDVNVFSPALDNAAGDHFIRDASSELQTAAAHPQGLVMYTRGSAHLMQWSGAPFYFGVRTASTKIGALGQNAVAPVQSIHYGMGLTGIWAYALGQEPEYLDDPAIHDYVYQDIDMDNAHKSTVWYDQQQDLVIFSYPSKEDAQGEPSRSVALSRQTGGWSPLDFAATAAAQQPVFQYASAADFLGGIYWHGIRGAGGGLPFDTQGFISFGEEFTVYNYYGISGYGMHGYGGPSS